MIWINVIGELVNIPMNLTYRVYICNHNAYLSDPISPRSPKLWTLLMLSVSKRSEMLKLFSLSWFKFFDINQLLFKLYILSIFQLDWWIVILILTYLDSIMIGKQLQNTRVANIWFFVFLRYREVFLNIRMFLFT